MSQTATTARPRLVTPQFAMLGVAALAYFFADGLLVPSVPLYVTGPLASSDVSVGMAVGAFSLSALLLRPWAGRFADRRGRSTVMIFGGLVFAASVAGYSLADSVAMLVALRLLTGVGEAFFFVGAVTAMSDLAPAERRGEAISLFSLSLYVGLAVGPPLGEAVVGAIGFGTVWVFSSCAAVLSVVLASRVGDTREPGPTESGGRLIHPAAVVPGLLLLALVWGMAGFLAFVPLYALDLGLAGAGPLMFVFAGIVVVIRSIGARIPDRLGAARSVRLALSCCAIGLAIIGSWRAVPGLAIGTVVLGVGIAFGTPAIMMLALQGIPAAERGAVMGTVSMSIDLALGLGPATFGLVAAGLDRSTGFLTAALVATAGFLLASRTTHRSAALQSGG
ncbi:putative MFS family arabinose efflux permease [Kribbella sp. VKM Ac-2527]|uniref:Putative MFS family arabinose efflux permease n=1 Tax=Kribbella caucasensis TaxID=2512215 RepID=A0A4R6K6W0_9ACTN|nr:MFS transporter [Kribbella sp. VKM Ac-2527]TDO43075.1 putative MFS family arabinose efflux permease [Kribbella sp. VKM Ac-2527]